MNADKLTLLNNILNTFAERYVEADKCLEMIGNETPIDNTAYAQEETKRDVLWQCMKTVEGLGQLEPWTVSLKIKHTFQAKNIKPSEHRR